MYGDFYGNIIYLYGNIYGNLPWTKLNRYGKPVGFPFGNRMEDMQRFTREVKTYVVCIYLCT